MLSAREAVELRQFFEIRSDLAVAARDAAADDIDFHLGELAIMALHTTSERLRRACRTTVMNRLPQPAAIIA